MLELSKYIIIKGQIVTVRRESGGFWKDEEGTIYAYTERSLSVDDNETCGILGANLPDWDYFRPLNQVCKVHDYMGMSPVYQAFHTFTEANDYLEDGIEKYGEHLAWLAKPFRFFATVVKFWWDNKETLR